MASTLRFISDLIPWVALGAFVAVSLGLILWSVRKRRATSGRGGLVGVVPALIAGVLIAVPITFLDALFAWWMTPERMVREVILPSVLLTAGPIALAVLDVFAIWPPARRTGAGAAGRASLGVVLVVVLVALVSWTTSSLDSAAGDLDQAATRRAEAARSVGLAIEVAVVDVKLGAVNSRGRLVSELKLDITVRSASRIQLRQAEEMYPNLEAWIRPADSAGFKLPGGLPLPTLIPVGFDETYRITAPLSTDVTAEYYVTGPWEAQLYLDGPFDEAAGLPITYKATAVFAVPAAP